MIISGDLEISGDGVTQIALNGKRRNISKKELDRLLKSRKAIGQAGEKWVLQFEKAHLIKRGKRNLADRVRRISDINVSAGYDILSFTSLGAEKYIEVKTTVLSKQIFYISSNELKTSEKLKQAYWIYFVTEIFGNPQLLPIQNPHDKIGTILKLTPTNYQVEIHV